MRIFASILWLLIAACSSEQPVDPTYHASENPAQLSAWGMLIRDDDTLQLNDGVTPYDLATPLFSDYAKKLRTVWMPEGTSAQYNADTVFDFPVGTVITKTFYYQTDGGPWTGKVLQGGEFTIVNNALPTDAVRLLETRILVRREHGWDALPYVWNEDQSDAYLKRTGAVMPLTLVRNDGREESFAYLAPNVNQCAGCHGVNATTKEIQPIGPKARHLNKASSFMPAFNQLDHWVAKGMLSGDVTAPAPRNAVWTDVNEPLDLRARAYLDANCSHCHNPVGPADTSGLNLEPDASGPALGTCKTPIAAGTGTGGRAYDIVPGDPEASITLFRIETLDPGAMMPELGRAVTHEEGVALVSDWIAAMDGGC